MPIPPSTMLSTTARQVFDRLRGGPRPVGGFQGRTVAPLPMRGGPGIDYPSYIDQICASICSAWSTWQSTATLTGVVINGVTAMGGRVVGPPLAALIQAGGPSQTQEALKLTQSIATGLGGSWAQFTGTISVTGLPWYPAFAVVASPVAPPTPNVPTPIAALNMAANLIGKMLLKNAMAAADPVCSTDHQNLYEAIAEAFEQAFQLWKTTTMVTNVMGTGPVPTFAPPYVPVGPVVGGTGTMMPGGFA